MSQNDESWRHHFIPEFYLKYWALGKGKRLCAFTRPYGPKVKPSWLSPKATGYEPHLYRFELGNGQPVDIFEKKDLGKIDHEAAIVFAKIHAKKLMISMEEMLAFARFVSSLLQRDPDTVAALKQRVEEDYQSFVAYMRKVAESQSQDAETINRFIASSEANLAAQASLSTLRVIIDNPMLRDILENMIWEIVDVSDSGIKLLTSDRPVVVMESKVHGPHSLVALPISPDIAIFGLINEEILKDIKAKPSSDIAGFINHHVTRQAVKAVYAVDESSLGYVQSNMGKTITPSFQKRIGLALLNRNASGNRGPIEDEPQFRQELQRLLDEARAIKASHST